MLTIIRCQVSRGEDRVLFNMTTSSLLFVFLLSPLVAWSHMSGRYFGRTGVAYQATSLDWEVIMDFDSINQCASLCTWHNCKLFETMLFDDIAWSDFRGFRCYILTTDINATMQGTSVHGHKLVQWTPKTNQSTARTVQSNSGGSLPSECPVIYRKWPSTTETNGDIISNASVLIN